MTLFGLNDGVPVSESVTLNGTGAVTGTTQFDGITGAQLNGLSVGDITITMPGPAVTTLNEAANKLLAAMTTGTVSVASSLAADAGQSVLITGVDSQKIIISEVLSLNGTTTVTGTKAFKDILSVSITGTTTGTVTLKDLSLIHISEPTRPY